MPQLPPEILDHIFHILRLSSHISTLRRCLKVSPLFCFLAERHLYYNLTLGFSLASNNGSHPTELAPRHALDLLTDTPHIAPYVRSLHIRLPLFRTTASSWPPSWAILQFDPPVALVERASAVASECIAAVLPRLTKLEYVILRWDEEGRLNERKKPWDMLDTGFVEAFAHMLAVRGEGLKGVEVSNAHCFPLEVLSCAGGLERVRLEGWFTFGGGRVQPSGGGHLDFSNLQFKNLRSLTLGNCFSSFPDTLAWLAAPSALTSTTRVPSLSSRSQPRLVLPQLTHLSAMLWTVEHYTHLSAILSACRESLEDLILDVGASVNLLYYYDAYANDDPPLLGLPESSGSLATQLGLAPHAYPTLTSTSASPSLSLEACLVFALGTLPALRHLTLRGDIRLDESFWSKSDEDNWEEFFYWAPFAWVQKVLDGVRVHSTNADSRPAASGLGSGSYSDSASLQSALEHLTLEIDLPRPDSRTSHALSKIQWSHLTSALASFCSDRSCSSTSFEPTSSSRHVELLLSAERRTNNANHNANTTGNRRDNYLNVTRLESVINALQDDAHLREFVEQDVVRIGVVGTDGERPSTSTTKNPRRPVRGPQLPLEIIDHILLALRLSSNIPSLHTCLEVSHTFRALAERHVYYHLALSSVPTSRKNHPNPKGIRTPSAKSRTTTSRLAVGYVRDLIASRPHVAAHVRSLRICLAASFRPSKAEDLDERVGLLAGVAAVLPLLPRLKHIILHGEEEGRRVRVVRWRKQINVFKGAFLDVLAARGLGKELKSVWIHGVEGFPLGVLGCVGGLEKVRLEECCTFRGEPGDDVPVEGSRSRAESHLQVQQLRSLTLRHCTSSFQTITAWLAASSTANPALHATPSATPLPSLSLPHLTFLDATLRESADYTSVSSILAASRFALEELVLDPADTVNVEYDSTEDPEIDVHATLVVENIGKEDAEEVVYSVPFDWMRKVLDGIHSTSGGSGARAATMTASSSESLERLTIDITVPRSASAFALASLCAAVTSLGRVEILLRLEKDSDVGIVRAKRTGNGNSDRSLEAVAMALLDDACLSEFVERDVVRVVIRGGSEWEDW
ncbi:hypothetical protein CVT26_002375 [Gymnopilus dilepis]|uniref:F-box domain-containing protein n=1 Tax=Gymnopilus dilepis TaxID=231916 RepID=A0A409Y3R0_9AGAR|nr:hypothetical protein CVT26_002375 [Gymnopilus dilepis]